MEKAEVLSQRLYKIRKAMLENDVDALIIPRTEQMATVDVRYLSGFTGSMGFVVITPDKALISVDSRYTQQAKKEVHNMDVVEWKDRNHLFTEVISGVLGNAQKAGFISEETTVGFYNHIKENIPSVELVPLPPIVTSIRAVKSEEEIEMITRSLRATESALRHAFTFVRPGISELEVAEAFEDALPRGAKLAFESIIASGERSIEAHGRASDKIIEAGDVVQFDVGCMIDGYASDISRVVICGTATSEQRKMHMAIFYAIKGALPWYRSGQSTLLAHNAALKVLDDFGYGDDKFRHGLGHGIGLNVHEYPGVTEKEIEGVLTTFESGQVVTVEPGVYSEKLRFGMRIEEDILITPNGHMVLDCLSTRLVETDKL